MICCLTAVLGALAAVEATFTSLLAHETTAEYCQTAAKAAPILLLFCFVMLAGFLKLSRDRYLRGGPCWYIGCWL